MSAAGAPSAAATSGFVVSAAPTRALKPGLLLYTAAGAAQPPAPFSGGLLCLSAPLRRSTAVADTAGTPGQCDGVLAIDLSAFAAGLLGGNPQAWLRMPGVQVDCQFWGRDTTAGALLSDALEFVVCD